MLQRFGVVKACWEATREFVTIYSPTMAMDGGRFAVTQEMSDLYVFKVPSLRNITRTYPYFHDGSAWSLRGAHRAIFKGLSGSSSRYERRELRNAATP